MTSREIAELTGKLHKDVLYDIRNMLSQLGLDSADFSAQYRDPTGRMLPMFNLPKDLTITLVSGYSIPMRHKIVTRWQQLETQVATSSSSRPMVPRGAPHTSSCTLSRIPRSTFSVSTPW